MGKIYMLMGKSGCGKDTILKGLLAINKDVKPIIPYTTRSKRVGEVDGVEYFFRDERHLSDAIISGRLIEYRTYHKVEGDVSYYTLKDTQFEYLKEGNCIVIGTLDVYNSYVKHFGAENIIPIYINVPELERLNRMLEREKKESKPAVIEVCRRLVDDNREFAYDKLCEVDKLYIIDNQNLTDAVLLLNKMITAFEYYNFFTVKDYTEDMLLYGKD